MNVLTPSGYVDASTLQVGDSVCAFDENTGAPIVNQVETVAYVDLSEWQRWWKPMVDSGELADYPPFAFYAINGTWTLNSEQSIWRNGTNVCHVRHLIVGDTIYDDTDNPVVVTSFDPVASDGWYRFDISGDHSYIVDGLTLHNASRFCKPGAGTADWTSSNTAIWAATTNGATGQSVPGSADTVTCDANFGGGTCRVNFGGAVTVQSITCGAMVGTLDFSVFNNDVTLSATAAFSGSGTATRTINLGNGTWSLTTTSNNVTPWTFATTTGLTFNANSSVIDFTGTVAAGLSQSFSGGALSYNSLRVSGARFDSGLHILGTANSFAVLTNTAASVVSLAAGNTITTLTQSAQLTLSVAAGTTLTITNAPTLTGTAALPLAILNSTTSGNAGTATVSCASGAFSGSYCAIMGMTFAGGATFSFTNSFDNGKNSGATITAPSAGGGLITNQGMSGGMA